MSFLLENVGFSYRANRSNDAASRPPAILKGVNQAFASDARVALLGPSGAGKSTLICLLGLLTGTQQIDGDIRYTNSAGIEHSYHALTPAEADEMRRTEFGFALQSSYLLPHLTVVENLAIPLGLHGVSPKSREERALAMLRAADPRLLKHADYYPSQISGGQKQRVAVLRSLIHDPVVVFADEPFSALDDENKSIILNILKTWQDGGFRTDRPAGTMRSLFLVCHDPKVPAAHGADVLHMLPGEPPRLIGAGRP